MRKVLILTVMLMVCSAPTLVGQETYKDFMSTTYRINSGGMLVLGSWAAANIISGAIGWSRNIDQRMYFHQMNFFWNVVNLSIAGVGLYGSQMTDFSLWSGDEMINRQGKIQQLFLINAGLDIGYMGAGLILNRIAPKYPKNQNRLAGYGNSVMLQGGFLFIFDLVLYGIQRSHRLDFLDQISLSSMNEAMGVSISIIL